VSAPALHWDGEPVNSLPRRPREVRQRCGAVKWYDGSDHGLRFLVFGSLAIVVICALWSVLLILLIMNVLPRMTAWEYGSPKGVDGWTS